jgi:hypothetical protein
MRELDPWSFQYESFLAAAYFNSGDLEGFRQSLRRVQILAPDSEEYKKLLMLIQENESKT